MSLRCEEFSYEKYKILTEPNVVDIPIEQLAELDSSYKRYVRILMSNGITTTKTMVHEYYICNLANIKGLGKKFYSLLTDFVENQNHYKKLAEDGYEKE